MNKNDICKINDWRLNGQEEKLYGKNLMYCKYKNTSKEIVTHEHCVFCWHKFMEDCSNIDDCSNYGYCTLDKKYWICEDCFSDFKEIFEWEMSK